MLTSSADVYVSSASILSAVGATRECEQPAECSKLQVADSSHDCLLDRSVRLISMLLCSNHYSQTMPVFHNTLSFRNQETEANMPAGQRTADCYTDMYDFVSHH